MNNKNVKIEQNGNESVTLEIDLTKTFGPSASGKTETVALCREDLGNGITIQVNVWKKIKFQKG